MRPVSKLAWLAGFVALSLLAAVVVVASLLDVQTGATHSYRAIFADASGLQGGDPVRIAGIKVGRVFGVALHGRDAEITFTVASSQVVDDRTTAAIHYESLLGQRNLTLSRPAGTPAPASGPGCGKRCIPISRTTPALDLTDLFNGFQPLFEALTPSDVNTLTANIIAAFQGESPNVAGLVDDAATLTTNLADRDQVIGQVIDNLTQTMQLLGGHDQQLASLIDSFAGLTGQLAGERQTISSALASTSGLTSSLNGLISAVQQPFESDVAGLNQGLGAIDRNSKSLSALLAQLPPTLTNVDRMFDNGGFAKAYTCSTEIVTSGPIVLVPTAIQQAFNIAPGVLDLLDNTLVVKLPSGPIGNAKYHTPTCK